MNLVLEATGQQAVNRSRPHTRNEAEWEYAARGGTKTARYWGERAEDGCAYENMADLTFKKINPDSNIANMANCEDGHATTAPVGSFKPNPIGLYDMLGNVTEFVADCYVVNLRELPKDGRAMEKENCFDHTIRGGNFWFDTRQVRAAYRTSIDQTTRMRNIGFTEAKPHDGTIVTDKVNEMWGTDMTQTITIREGRANVFV